jgi:hypothetical protein
VRGRGLNPSLPLGAQGYAYRKCQNTREPKPCSLPLLFPVAKSVERKRSQREVQKLLGM